MRIAILSAAKSIHTVRWVNALAQRGHAVALYSLPDHRAPEGAFPRQVRVYYLRHGGVAGYWLGGRELRRELEAFAPDLLNAHYATGYGTLARRSGFKPLLLSVWGSDVYDFPFRNGFSRRLVIKNLDAATALASTSRVMAEQVESFYFNRKPIFITPFGVDTEQFRPMNLPHREGVTVGIVKALEPEYGIEYLLEAFSFARKRLMREGRLPEGGLWLEIYGRGSQLEALKGLAERLGIEEYTRFQGPVAHARVPEAINSMDIFCAPSLSESFGVAVVEAMACGVPVVASDVGGFREVIRNRETGFIVTRRDAAQLANRICDLACDPQLRARMGAAGREHVRAEYEWSRCVDAMEQAFERTLAL